MKHYIIEGIEPTDAQSQARIAQIQPAHIAHVEDGVRQGLVLGAGPKSDGTGGCIILRAESREAVDRFIAEDPKNIPGLHSYRVTEFQIMEHAPLLDPWLK